MQQSLNIRFENDTDPGFLDIQDINQSFARGTLKIMYTGKNRNGSYIDKDAVLRALPSLYNVPIVANYSRDDDDIGSHDIEVVTKNDELALINATQPCGVIPDHAKFRFEVLMDKSGLAHEYLIAENVIIWKRQEIYDTLVNRYQGKIAHSMEINVNSGFLSEREEAYVIDDFEFTALCLLGAEHEPCFEGSALELKSNEAFSRNMKQMFAEMKQCFAELSMTENEDELAEPSNEDVEDKSAKGGKDMKDEEINVEEQTEEVVAEDEFEDAPVAGQVDTDKMYEAMESAVAENDKYWMLHIEGTDGSNEYSMLLQSKADHCAYAVKAVYENDNLSVDWDNPTAMAYAVVAADNPEGHTSLPGTEVILTANNDFAKQVTDFEAQLNAMNVELAELREFKTQIESANAAAAREELLGQFTDLEGLDELEELKANAEEMEINELEEKLYALRGRNIKFSIENLNKANKKTEPVKRKVNIPEKDNNDLYGGIFKKFKLEEE